MFLRFMAGAVGGVCFGILPPTMYDMFSSSRGGLGGTLCYIMDVAFILLASLMDKFFGGNQGLASN